MASPIDTQKLPSMCLVSTSLLDPSVLSYQLQLGLHLHIWPSLGAEGDGNPTATSDLDTWEHLGSDLPNKEHTCNDLRHQAHK